jgi:mRNA turnover protein 4
MVALGKTEENETLPGLHKVSECLVGDVGLFFTNRPAAEIVEFFNKYNQSTFARAGDVSNVTVKVLKGPLPQFSHAIEGHLREKLKFPTKLDNGVVTLMQDFFLATDGERMSADQCNLLKLFGKF